MGVHVWEGDTAFLQTDKFRAVDRALRCPAGGGPQTGRTKPPASVSDPLLRLLHSPSHGRHDCNSLACCAERASSLCTILEPSVPRHGGWHAVIWPGTRLKWHHFRLMPWGFVLQIHFSYAKGSTWYGTAWQKYAPDLDTRYAEFSRDYRWNIFQSLAWFEVTEILFSLLIASQKYFKHKTVLWVLCRNVCSFQWCTWKFNSLPYSPRKLAWNMCNRTYGTPCTIRLNAMRMFILEWSVWTLDLVGSGRSAPAPCTFRKYINTHLCIYMYEYVSVSMLPSNHQIAQNLRQWKRNYACSLRTGTRLRKHILCSYVCSLWAYMYIS